MPFVAKASPRREQLNSHMMTKKHGQLSACSEFRNKIAKKRGVNGFVQTGENPFDGPECDDKLSYGNGMNMCNSVSSEKRYVCCECNKGFSILNSLYPHLKVHNESIENANGVRGADETTSWKFWNWSWNRDLSFVPNVLKYSLKKSIWEGITNCTWVGICRFVIDSEKWYVCPECDKMFLYKYGLIRHMKFHSGEKPFTCTVCEKKFTLKNSVESHMNIHSGEKPFACSECGRGFSWERNLKIHFKSHIGEKPFACYEYKMTFSSIPDIEHSYEIAYCGKSDGLFCGRANVFRRETFQKISCLYSWWEAVCLSRMGQKVQP